MLNHFEGLAALTEAILAFIARRNEAAKPIQWTYTFEKLQKKLGVNQCVAVLSAGGRVVVADIAFASVQDRSRASEQWADSWDTDEFYWAPDEASTACARVGL